MYERVALSRHTLRLPGTNMSADRVLDALYAVFRAAERGDEGKLAWLLDPPWWSRCFPCMEKGDPRHLMFALAGALFGCHARVAEMAFVRIQRHGVFVIDVVKRAIVQVVFAGVPPVELAISFALQWFQRRFGLSLTDARDIVGQCWMIGGKRKNVLCACECACALLSLDDSIHLLMYLLYKRFPPWYPILVHKLLGMVSSSSGPPHRALPDDLYYWVVKQECRDGEDYVDDLLQHAQQVGYSNLSEETLGLWQERWPLRMQQCRAWSTLRAAWVCAVYRGACLRVRA